LAHVSTEEAVYKAGERSIQNRGWAMAALPQFYGDGDEVLRLAKAAEPRTIKDRSMVDLADDPVFVRSKVMWTIPCHGREITRRESASD